MMFKLKHKLPAMVGISCRRWLLEWRRVWCLGRRAQAAEGKYRLRRVKSRFCYSNKGNKAKKHLTFGKKHFKLLALSGYSGGYAAV